MEHQVTTDPYKDVHLKISALSQSTLYIYEIIRSAIPVSDLIGFTLICLMYSVLGNWDMNF